MCLCDPNKRTPFCDNCKSFNKPKMAEVIIEGIEKEPSTQEKIEIVCDSLQRLLKTKNKNYGDSAINPLKIFSAIEPGDEICIRLDDKLGRIKSAAEQGKRLRKNDVADLAGYLVLLLIKKDWLILDELID
jgi:hypothetical protein